MSRLPVLRFTPCELLAIVLDADMIEDLILKFWGYFVILHNKGAIKIKTV